MAVPDGLERRPVCDEYRGACVVDTVFNRGAKVQVACVCDGIVCPRCGVNQMHRPISNRYDEVERKVLHVPYFMGWAGCKECRRARKSRDIRGV
jgi:hypothetical protein